MMKKFITAVWAAGMFVAFAAPVAAQQPYPNKPIRFIVTTAAGNSSSNLARIIGQSLTERWGQQVLVDNRPGGNSIIGAKATAESPPDGYTIMLMTNTQVIAPHLIPDFPDPIKEFAPVTTVAISELALVLHPSVPANNLQEFIALAKSKPGQLNYATTSSGSSIHLANELFNSMVGIKMESIAYKGGSIAMADLIGGHIQAGIAAVFNVSPHVKAGQLKAIAVTGKIRSPALPQVPTFAEAGLENYNAAVWYGVVAPAGTQKEIVNKLSTEIVRILAAPDVKEKLVNQGLVPFLSTSEQFSALIKTDLERFGKIIKTANIKLQ